MWVVCFLFFLPPEALYWTEYIKILYKTNPNVSEVEMFFYECKVRWL